MNCTVKLFESQAAELNQLQAGGFHLCHSSKHKLNNLTQKPWQINIKAWGRVEARVAHLIHLLRRKRRELACKGYLVGLPSSSALFLIQLSHCSNIMKCTIKKSFGWLTNFYWWSCRAESGLSGVIETIDAEWCLLDYCFHSFYSYSQYNHNIKKEYSGHKMMTIANMSYDHFKTEHKSLSVNHNIFIWILYILLEFKYNFKTNWMITALLGQYIRFIVELDIKTSNFMLSYYSRTCKCHGNSPGDKAKLNVSGPVFQLGTKTFVLEPEWPLVKPSCCMHPKIYPHRPSDFPMGILYPQNFLFISVNQQAFMLLLYSLNYQATFKRFLLIIKVSWSKCQHAKLLKGWLILESWSSLEVHLLDQQHKNAAALSLQPYPPGIPQTPLTRLLWRQIKAFGVMARFQKKKTQNFNKINSKNIQKLVYNLGLTQVVQVRLLIATLRTERLELCPCRMLRFHTPCRTCNRFGFDPSPKDPEEPHRIPGNWYCTPAFSARAQMWTKRVQLDPALVWAWDEPFLNPGGRIGTLHHVSTHGVRGGLLCDLALIEIDFEALKLNSTFWKGRINYTSVEGLSY
ncbi:hypothetical protein VP01_102g1 [Puccinia sorghi]|uniref:Uncharacterized protein n=1 Tax=Puccinia sorghi TaxID=27349 RepID=A0A0L6VVZ9_9BASI|nr:hypothetical protein VP01_102g1 [Puccinia sorghi]